MLGRQCESRTLRLEFAGALRAVEAARRSFHGGHVGDSGCGAVPAGSRVTGEVLSERVARSSIFMYSVPTPNIKYSDHSFEIPWS